MSLEGIEDSIIGGADSLIQSPLFLKGALIFGAATVIFVAVRFAYRKVFEG
jgi:hypothetical protein